MSNDPYENLTDEEKVLLKREMKFRIQQQREREKLQGQLPLIVIGSAATTMTLIAFLLLVSRSPWDKENIFFLILIVSAGSLLFGVGLWLWRHNKRSDTKNLKGGSSKNKRG